MNREQALHWLLAVGLGALLAGLLGCTGREYMSASLPARQAPRSLEPKTQDSAMPKVSLDAVKSWSYWLQQPDLGRLKNSPYDLLVVDYAHEGHAGSEFNKTQINDLRLAGKIVLAYLSIGEAEEYRFYWQKGWKASPPSFLGPENPDWPQNHKVRYWEQGWWDMALRPYLDRILAAGFNGLYLDIVDAYYYWGEEQAEGEEGQYLEQRADDMVALISRIAHYCRSRSKGRFFICIQNGFGILDDASTASQTKLLKTIDIAASEDLFFHYYNEEDKAYRTELMQRLAEAGKLLLTVEYVKPGQYADYLRQAQALPFKVVPYAATPDRALDCYMEPLR